MGYAMPGGCDHVAGLPQVTGGHWWLKSVEALFVLTFVLWVRPHRVANLHHPAHVGVGACNLVRTEMYRAVDGHQRLALRSDDDVKLGLVLKRHGARPSPRHCRRQSAGRGDRRFPMGSSRAR